MMPVLFLFDEFDGIRRSNTPGSALGTRSIEVVGAIFHRRMSSDMMEAADRVLIHKQCKVSAHMCCAWEHKS